MDLATLGWNAWFEERFAGHRAAGLVPARVATEDKHAYTVVGDAGEWAAVVAGKLLHQSRGNADLPKVGDWVAVAPQPGEPKAVIRAVLPRRTQLVRKVTGREVEEQVLAANVDTVFVTLALDATFNLRRLERFLVMVLEGGARPVVVLNKADVCDDPEACVAAARRAAGDAPVLVVSARTRKGIGQLREFIRPGETVVFIGTSGVGKSSLINRLYGEEIQATIEVREADAKGRHTTTWRELIPLPGGGLVIDTPGMREFHMWAAEDGISEAFPELLELAQTCRFRDCTHVNEPGCAVRAAAESGQLSRERYESFLKLQREAAFLAEERRQHTYLARQRAARGAQRAYDRSARERERTDE
jgi:ribosome biogenesis GTPase